MTPGTITRTLDGRYEVHSLTTSVIVANEQLAELAAARVRKAFGVASNTQSPKKAASAGVRRKKRQDGA